MSMNADRSSACKVYYVFTWLIKFKHLAFIVKEERVNDSEVKEDCQIA